MYEICIQNKKTPIPCVKTRDESFNSRGATLVEAIIKLSLLPLLQLTPVYVLFLLENSFFGEKPSECSFVKIYAEMLSA